jgi:hypothetical protein
MRNPPFHPATNPLVLAALPPGQPVPPGTCDPACNTKRTNMGSNRAANAEASPERSTPGDDVCHVSGPPTGAASTYEGTLVDGPADVEPGATGTCVDGVGDGEALDDGAADGASAEVLVEDGDVGCAPELLPVCAVAPEWLDEHPARTTETTAMAADVMTLPLKVLPTRHYSRCSPGVNAK